MDTSPLVGKKTVYYTTCRHASLSLSRVIAARHFPTGRPGPRNRRNTWSSKTLFANGDVLAGRGKVEVLREPSERGLHEVDDRSRRISVAADLWKDPVQSRVSRDRDNACKEEEEEGERGRQRERETERIPRANRVSLSSSRFPKFARRRKTQSMLGALSRAIHASGRQ